MLLILKEAQSKVQRDHKKFLHSSTKQQAMWSYFGAAATVRFAEQDSVEPKANKARCWEGAGIGRTRTTHILPSPRLQLYATVRCFAIIIA